MRQTHLWSRGSQYLISHVCQVTSHRLEPITSIVRRENHFNSLFISSLTWNLHYSSQHKSQQAYSGDPLNQMCFKVVIGWKYAPLIWAWRTCLLRTATHKKTALNWHNYTECQTCQIPQSLSATWDRAVTSSREQQFLNNSIPLEIYLYTPPRTQASEVTPEFAAKSQRGRLHPAAKKVNDDYLSCWFCTMSPELLQSNLLIIFFHQSAHSQLLRYSKSFLLFSSPPTGDIMVPASLLKLLEQVSGHIKRLLNDMSFFNLKK